MTTSASWAHCRPRHSAKAGSGAHQLADAAIRLGEDTSRWGAPVPRCTGEEMVLHFILRRAAIEDTGSPPNEACEWPDSANPRGWGDLFEYLFQDHDVLMLYEMPAENAETAAGAINLEPSRWFSEFSLPYPVPDRL